MNLDGFSREAAAIHEAALKVLAEVGLRFRHPQALEVLAGKGFEVKADIVRFKSGPLLELIEAAPARVRLYGRRDDCRVELGADGTELAPAYGAPFISDRTGAWRPAELDDFRTLVKLFHQNDRFNINGGLPVQPAGVPLERLLYESLRLTDKVLMIGTGYREEMDNLMAMLAIVFGGPEALRARPRVTTIINSNTPLVFDRSQLDSLFALAENGQPPIVSAGMMPGASSPLPLAGTLAVGTAESLAGVALVQAIRPGSPVVYGGLVPPMDLRTGNLAGGGPELAQAARLVAELGHGYGLPVRSSAAATDAHTVSAQSGTESMLGLIAALDAGVDIMVHAAGIMHGFNAVALEKVITDFEMIEQVYYQRQPINIDADHLALESIAQVGPGGNYLLDPTTMKYCRIEPFIPKLAIRGHQPKPADEAYFDLIEAELNRLLGGYAEPSLDPDIDRRLRDFLTGRGIDPVG